MGLFVLGFSESGLSPSAGNAGNPAGNGRSASEIDQGACGMGRDTTAVTLHVITARASRERRICCWRSLGQCPLEGVQ